MSFANRFSMLLLLTLIFNCSSFKTVENNEKMNTYGLGKDYTFDVSKDWFMFDWHGNLNLAPKKLKKSNFNLLNNNMYIFESDGGYWSSMSLEEFVKASTKNNEGNYSTVISSTNEINKNHFIVTIIKKHTDVEYKELIHYRKNGAKAYIIRYKMKVGLFNKYLNEARIVFNSFKLID